MKIRSFALLQLDEACRYIKDNRLAQLRIALLLLDNTAEILMDRCVANHLSWENIHERLRSKILEIPQNSRTSDLQEIVEWQPLTPKRKVAIFKYFGEKVIYLSERAESLDATLVKPLCHLHRYRNEAYHQGKVRKETIETAAKLYFDINCDLLLKLPIDGIVYSSNDDYSWLENRFNSGEKILFSSEDIFINAIKELREQVNINDTSVVRILGSHIESRMNEVQNDLDFIIKNTHCPDKQTAIHDSLFFAAEIRKNYGKIKQPRENIQSNYSLEFLDSLLSCVSKIYNAENRLEAFKIFSDIETELEPIEDDIREVVIEIDNHIQMEIEIARGK